MYRIRIRVDGRWSTLANYHDRDAALADYNSCGITPRMFIGPRGIENKQYSNNGYQWKG